MKDLVTCPSMLEISNTNTPNMFQAEVADFAMECVIALACETFQIDDREHRDEWPNSRGILLAGKTMALVGGVGIVGKNAAKRMLAAGMKFTKCDPFAEEAPEGAR